MRRFVILGVLGLSLLGVARGDWPQFGGPQRNFTSDETGLVDSLDSKPKVLWQADVNPGYSGAAIKDGQVFFLDRVDDKRDVLKVYDLKSGRRLWSCSVSDPGDTGKFPGQRSTPSVTDRYVLAVGARGGVYCFDRDEQKLAWSKHLVKDYGAELPRWVCAQSPLVHGETVIVAPQSHSTGLVALDVATGREVWKSPSVGGMEYTSPDILKLAGREHLVMFTKKGIAGLDPENGRPLWGYTGWKGRVAAVPQPVIVDEDRLFLTSGYRVGSAVIEVKPSGDGFAVEEISKTKQISCQMQTPILIGEHVYGLDNGNGRMEGMVCADRNGKVVWKSGRRPGFERGQMIYADGKLFVMHGQTGKLHIVKPSPEGFNDVSSTAMLSGRQIWAPMALTDGLMVLRDQSKLKCIDLRK